MERGVGTKTFIYESQWKSISVLVPSPNDIEHVYNIEWIYDVMMTSFSSWIYLWYLELFPLGLASSARSLVLHICKLCNFFAAVLASFACLYTIKHTNKIKINYKNRYLEANIDCRYGKNCRRYSILFYLLGIFLSKSNPELVHIYQILFPIHILWFECSGQQLLHDIPNWRFYFIFFILCNKPWKQDHIHHHVLKRIDFLIAI